MHYLLKNLTAAAVLSLSIAAHTFANASPEEALFYEKVAYNYVLAHFRDLPDHEKVTVEVSKVDPKRSFGGRCEGFLTAEITGGSLRENSTVKIVCADPQKPFTLYVPVKITYLETRLVASRDLARGQMIGQGDFTEEFVEKGRSSTEAINSPSQLTGVRLKREVKEGELFFNSNICTVCKGDRVTIEASGGNLSLKTSGEALEDGNLNETIRVRNLKTKKIIPGIVAAPGSVVIHLD